MVKITLKYKIWMGKSLRGIDAGRAQRRPPPPQSPPHQKQKTGKGEEIYGYKIEMEF